MKKYFTNIDWVTTLWVVLTPLLSVILAVLYFQENALTWRNSLLFVVFYFIGGLSISAGYHRLFSHLTYTAHPWLRGFLLFVGAGTFEGPCIKWATDHRRHHRCVDTDEDPYNINQGFFYAHVGWLLTNENPKYKNKFEKDLANDPMIAFQHRYYVPLAIAAGFGLPTLVGWMFGSAYDGFLFGGLLRIVAMQHSTFLVNSACHYFGTRPYNLNNSARDSFWMALLTNGEGYHNYHHRFQSDYRNGIRWFHWDPSKWIIFGLSKVGMAERLMKIPDYEIFKAKLQVQEKALIQKGWKHEALATMRRNVETSYQKVKLMYETAKNSPNWRYDVQHAKREFRLYYWRWRTLKNLRVA